MPQQVFDLASLLIFLASGGLAYKLPGWLESWDWFQSLASPGKVVSVTVLTLIPTFGALAAQGWLVQHPMVSDAIDPYVRAAIIAINIALTQMFHGAAKVQERQLNEALESFFDSVSFSGHLNGEDSGSKGQTEPIESSEPTDSTRGAD